MPTFEPASDDYRDRVRACFEAQEMLGAIGAVLARVEPGEVELALPYRQDLTQQHGYLHAGAITTLADSACGFAALSLMPADADVLSVEFKLNLLRPAAGQHFHAIGSVLKPGRTLTVTRGDVWADDNDGWTLIATLLATMIKR
jgi:uncharacterized protein (TIGR00369 family)